MSRLLLLGTVMVVLAAACSSNTETDPSVPQPSVTTTSVPNTQPGSASPSSTTTAPSTTVPSTSPPAEQTPEFVTWERATSPKAHTFWSLSISQSDPSVLFAATIDANVWRSLDGGDSWIQIADQFGAHIFSNIAINPLEPNTVFASNGFLFISKDGGDSWKPLFGSWDSLGVVSVAVAPGSPRVVYAGDDLRVLHRSIDGGNNWTEMGVIPGRGQLTELWIDPDDPNTLLAGSAFGIFRSEDGGRTFEKILGERVRPRTLVRDAQDPGTVYVVRLGRLLRSADRGRTFESVGLSDVVAVAPAGDRIYASTEDQVLTSDDSGATWQPTAYDPGLLGTSPALAVDPSNPQRVYSASIRTLGRSIDGGATWLSDAAGLEVDDFFTIALHPTEQEVIYAGLFWTLGVYRSDDEGRSWEWLDTYISTPPRDHYPMNISVLPGQPGNVFVTGVRGLRSTRDAGATWKPLIGESHAHGMGTSPSNPNVIYVGEGLGDFDKDVPGTRIYKSSDGGNKWQKLDLGELNGQDFNIYAIAVAASDENYVYIATNMHDWEEPHPEGHPSAIGVLRSQDGGESFEVVNSGLTERNAFAVAVDPRDAKVVYIGTAAEGRGRLFKSIDGGDTWARIDAGLPRTDVHSIALWPTDPNVLVVGLAQNMQAGTGLIADGSGVFVSMDGGETWDDISPDVDDRGQVVYTLTFTRDGSTLYAGTNDGMYRGAVDVDR